MLSDLMRRVSSWDPVFISASTPCQAYSTTDIHHLSDAPRLIPLIRDHPRATGRLYALENVKGAAPDLLDSAQLLDGAFFGLGVDRPRFFETSFDLVIDEYILHPRTTLRLTAPPVVSLWVAPGSSFAGAWCMTHCHAVSVCRAPPVADESALLRARAARVGAVSLTSQAVSGPSRVLIDGVPNPLRFGSSC